MGYNLQMPWRKGKSGSLFLNSLCRSLMTTTIGCAHQIITAEVVKLKFLTVWCKQKSPPQYEDSLQLCYTPWGQGWPWRKCVYRSRLVGRIVAFCHCICCGCSQPSSDPAALTFDQGAARKHLRLCLQRKQLELFLTTKELKFTKNRVTGREVESIYCLCRGIWVIGEDDMYRCSACSQWYHESCRLSLSPAHIFNHT